jgi:hypothetical protein
MPAEHAARVRAMVGEGTARAAETDWYDLVRWVRERHPVGVAAVVGYGSWYTADLRKPMSFPDLYVVVDDYARIHASRVHRWWNRLLPPNVYFVWSEGPGRHTLRGKYNVISRADLERECGPALRDVYNAGRLTKLVWIGWVRDEVARAEVVERVVDAHAVLTVAALALLPERFGPEAFSLELLALSYRGEARLEGWERVRALYDTHRRYYRALHAMLLDAFAAATGLLETTAPGEVRKVADPSWEALGERARRLVRRSRRRGYLRWPRIVLTEPNLLDLAVNEAERKAGVQIRVTPRLRRHPLLYGLPEFLRVLRERRTRERIGARTGPGRPRRPSE